MTTLAVAEDIKRFWFGNELLQNMNNMLEIEKRMSIWFSSSSAEFDSIQRNNSTFTKR